MSDYKKMSKEDPLDMTFDRLLCSRHGEPLRATWPKGYAIVMMEMMEVILNSEQVQKEAQELSGEEKPDPKWIESVLDKKPACCRLTKDQMLKVYLSAHKDAGLGVKARCEVCGKKRQPGTPYQTSHSRSQHVCFKCVLFRMQPIN